MLASQRLADHAISGIRGTNPLVTKLPSHRNLPPPGIAAH